MIIFLLFIVPCRHFIFNIKIQGRRYLIYAAGILMAADLRPFFFLLQNRYAETCQFQEETKKKILLKAFSDLRICGFEEEKRRESSVSKFWPKNGSNMKLSSFWLLGASHRFSWLVFFIRISNVKL